MNDLVSIVMPAHNVCRYIGQSIESVISQTYESWELIIVDDASEDETKKIIGSFKDPRIRTVTNRNRQGVSNSLNRGLECARGSLIARLDADDYSREDRLAIQVARFQGSPRLGLVGTWIRTFGKEEKKVRYPITDSALRMALCFRNPFAHSSVMFRPLDSRGNPWRYLNYPGQDYELWSRISCEYLIENIPEELTFYRKHDGQVTARFSHLYPPLVRGYQVAARTNFLVTQSEAPLSIRNPSSLPSFIFSVMVHNRPPVLRSLLVETFLFLSGEAREKLGRIWGKIGPRRPGSDKNTNWRTGGPGRNRLNKTGSPKETQS